MSTPIEPKEAFPYKAPDLEIKEKYKAVFQLEQPLKTPLPKRLFDILVSGIILIGCSPIVVLLFVANQIEGLIIPENRGPLFFYYHAVSGGQVFRKYKIRIIKEKYIDKELQAKGDWHAYAKEWTPESRTYLGQFVKKYYLDEIPQFYSVWIGEMSIVGPRPLAVHHYQRDLEQGNVTRFLLKGGLLGLGHIMKGTPEMGNPKYEYIYIDKFLNASPWQLLALDLTIIYRGIQVILKGKGL